MQEERGSDSTPLVRGKKKSLTQLFLSLETVFLFFLLKHNSSKSTEIHLAMIKLDVNQPLQTYIRNIYQILAHKNLLNCTYTLLEHQRGYI